MPAFRKFRKQNYSRVALVFITGATLFYSCTKNDISVVNDLTRTDSLPVQIVEDVTTIYSDSSLVQIMLKAPEVKHYTGNEEPLMEFPEGMHVSFFNRDGKIISTLDAQYAIYYEKEDLWEARDSVHVINEQQERLDAELLFWNINTERIYSDRSVKITTEDEIIYGEGFESDQTFNDWQITQVQGTVYIDKETFNGKEENKPE